MQKIFDLLRFYQSDDLYVPQTATLAQAAEADTDVIDVVEDAAELEVSTVDAAAPSEDTEEISEEGGEAQALTVQSNGGGIGVMSLADGFSAESVEYIDNPGKDTAYTVDGSFETNVYTATIKPETGYRIDKNAIKVTVMPEGKDDVQEGASLTTGDDVLTIEDGNDTGSVKITINLDGSEFVSSSDTTYGSIKIAVNPIKTYAVTINNTANSILELTYAIGAGEVTIDTPVEGDISVDDGATLKLQASVKTEDALAAQYEVSVGDLLNAQKAVKGGDPAVFTFENIAENKEVTVSATALYTVTEVIQDESKTLKEGAATISYTAPVGFDASKDIKADETLEFNVNPASGYAIKGVEAEGGTLSGSTNPYTISDITGNVTITVTVEDAEPEEIETYTVSVTTNGAKVSVDKTEVDGTEQEATGSATIEATEIVDDSITFTVAPKTGNKLRYVKVNTVEQNISDADYNDDDGVYTFTYEITGSTPATINIDVLASAKKEDLTVSFTELTDEKIDVYQVTPSGEVGENETTYSAAKIEEYKITDAAEDTTIYFAVVPQAESDYVVDEVTTDKGTLDNTLSAAVTNIEADEVTIYALDLTDVDSDVAVAISAELDETKANIVKFVAGDTDEFTVTEKTTSDEYGVENEYRTLDNEVTFVINPTNDEYYEIKGVELRWGGAETGETLDPEDGTENEYKVAFEGTEKRVATLVVTASVKGSNEEKTITFNAVSDSVLKVEPKEQKDIFTKKAGSDTIWTLAAGAQSVEFTVYVKEKTQPYVSLVTAGELENPQPGATEKVNKVNAVPYTYTVPAITFAKNDIVTIEAITEQKKIDITYDDSQVSLFVKQNGAAANRAEALVDQETATPIGTTYYVDVDAAVVLEVTPKDNCTTSKAVYTIGTAAEKTVTLKATGGEVSFKATDDVKMSIESTGLYTFSLTKDGKSVDKASSGKYDVLYNSEYSIAAICGVETSVKITDAILKNAKAAAEGETATTAAVQDDGTVKLTISALDANNNNLQVELKAGEADAQETIGTVSLNVLPKLDKITIKGITLSAEKAGELDQTIDSVEKYEITADPKTASLEKLEATVAEGKDGVVSAKVETDEEDGKTYLVVTTKPSKTEEDAVITVVDKTGANVTMATVTVHTKKQVLTPTVALKTSTDIDLTLTLGTTAKDPNEGALWYKVTVTPDAEYQGEKLTDHTDIMQAANTSYVRKTVEKASQDEKVTVSGVGIGNGKPWSFKVEVSLIQTTDKAQLTAEDAENVAFTSAESAKCDATTRNPYFETKLTLKKGKTTVYTGQKDVPIATVNFSKDTTYTADEYIHVTDVTYPESYYNGYKDGYGVDFSVKDGQILMSVNPYDRYGYRYYNTGKAHTIRVTAEAPEDTYTIYAEIKVTVVRGIENISVTPASNQIYKPDTKKAATLKATTVYNDGGTGIWAPKTKKATYELVNANNTGAFVDPLITINAKNGTVTVNKSFDAVKNSGTKFRIKATAADYEGSTVVDYSDVITISSTAQEIGKVYVLKYAGYDEETWEDYYEVVAKAGSNVTSDKLLYAYVVAFNPGTPEKETYTEGDLSQYAMNSPWDWGDENPKHLSFKSSNKAVTVNADGRITAVSKIANNVTIKVSANDGGKKSASLKFNVVNATPKFIGLKVERQDDYNRSNYDQIWADEDGILTDNGQSVALEDGTADTVLRISVVQRDSEQEDWRNAYQYANFKVATKNAKVLVKPNAYGTTTIIANKEKATITLTDSTSGTKVVKTFTITNAAAKTSGKDKYQKVTVSKNLSADYNIEGGQDIALQLNAKDKSKYESGNLVVMVKTDSADRAGKNAWKYNYFETLGDGINGYHTVSSDGKVYLHFDGSREIDEDYYITNIPAGTYKLQLTFGEVNREAGSDIYGSFIAKSQPVMVSVKSVATKYAKATYKPVTNIKMSVKDKASVVLTGKGKNYDSVDYYNLQNINYTGQSNKFTKYFKLGGYYNDNGKYVYTLDLQSKLSPDDIAFITGNSTEAKQARTGYVSYITSKEGGNVYSASGTVKLTVNFTKNGGEDALNKYAVSGATLLQGDKNTTVNVTVSKKPVELAYAIATEGDFTISDYGMKLNGNSIALSSSSATALAVGSYPVKLKIVPADSFYASSTIYDLWWAWLNDSSNAEKLAAYKKAITDYGVEVKTTIKVVAKDANVKKISIASADLKPKMSNDLYSCDMNQTYTAFVPFTTVIEGNDIHTIDSNDTLFEFNASNGDDECRDANGEYIPQPHIHVNVNKLALEAADQELKKKQPKKTVYGTTKTVTATITYVENDTEGNQVATPTIKQDKFTLKVTLPKKADPFDYASAKALFVKDGTYTDKVSELADKVSAEMQWNSELNGFDLFADDNTSWNGDTSNWRDQDWNDMSQEDKVGEYIDGVLGTMSDLLGRTVARDSDTEIKLTQMSDDWDYITVKKSDFQAPTTTADGYFNVNVKLIDTGSWNRDYDVEEGRTEGVPESGREVTPVTFRVVIPKTGEEPSDICTALEDYVKKINADEAKGIYYADNSTELNQIAKDAREKLSDTLDTYKSLRVDVWEPYESDSWDDTIYDDEDDEYYYRLYGNRYWDDDEWKFENPLSYIDAKGVSQPITTKYGPKKWADSNDNGYIAGVFHVWGIKYGGNEIFVPFVFSIPKVDSLSSAKESIMRALGDKETIKDFEEEEKAIFVKLAPTNRTTADDVMKVAKAAYHNEDIDLDWGEFTTPAEDATTEEHYFKVTPATSSNKGTIACALKLTQESEESPFEVTIEIPELMANDKAVEAVKTAVIDEANWEVRLDEDEDPTLKDEVISIVKGYLADMDADENADITEEITAQITADVKKLILDKANTALAGQPYVVEYAPNEGADKETKPDMFSFTPFTYKQEGSLSFTVQVKNLINGKLNGDELADEDADIGAVVDDKGALTLTPAIEFGADSSLITPAQAKAEIEDALATASEEFGNDTDEDAVVGAAYEAVDEAYGVYVAGKKVPVSDEEDAETESTFALKAATFTEAGSITGTLVLRKEDDDFEPLWEVEYDYNLTIAQLAQTEAAVRAEVTRVLKAMGEDLTDEDVAEEKRSDTETAIINKAKEIVTGSGYEIAKEATETQFTAPTLNNRGSIVIKFTLSKADGSSVEEPTQNPLEVTITIPTKTQNPTQVQEAINKVLDELYPNREIKKSEISGKDTDTIAGEIKTAVNDETVLKNTYKVEWKAEASLKAVDENGDATDTTDEIASYKGTLSILKVSVSGTEKEVATVDVVLTVVEDSMP